MKRIEPHWFATEDQPSTNMGDLLEAYHTYHPRVIFLKTLAKNSEVLDVGAGDGSLTVFRDWINPKRKDVSLYAYAAEKGSGFDNYSSFELGFWPEQKPDFGMRLFDAIYCSHFIEHIEQPLDFISWCVSRLRVGGRAYIEWPSPSSLEQPAATNFREVGIPLIISNFRDDASHVLDRNSIIQRLETAGAVIDQTGIVTNPFFEHEVRAHFGRPNYSDDIALTMAYWSKSRWAQYVVATKI
jgi:2-polyprenyl-3-methyl-5-hydroxy-6-metoxy-1,4-benzoquinol methylase